MTSDKFEENEGMISFLDVIACAFGAIVLLVLILPIGEQLVRADGQEIDQYNKERGKTIALEKILDEILADKAAKKATADSLRQAQARGFEDITLSKQSEDKLRVELEDLKQLNNVLSSILKDRNQELKEKTRVTSEKLPTHKFGIPVDSKYLIFVIDSSGSMKAIWSRVIATMQRILRLYPKLEGFRILNDQGEYLFSGNRSTWLSDSPSMRKQAMDKLRNWAPYSNSSPIEGIQKAVENLIQPGNKTAIFVLGDDYSRTDFDSYLRRIRDIVEKKMTNSSNLRIHAIGFSNETGSTNPERFGILMRSLALEHNGAFLLIGNEKPNPVDIRRGDRFVKQD